MDFNYIDIGIIVIILITALIGFMRGFVWMALFLSTWVAAILLAYFYKEQLASLLPIKLSSDAMQVALAALLIFLGTLIAGAIINYLFSKAVSAIGLGAFDRILGMGLGVVLGALGITLITMLMSFTELPSQNIWNKSKFIPKFQEAAEWIKTLVPENMSQIINDNISAGKAAITPTIEAPTGLINNNPSTPINSSPQN